MNQTFEHKTVLLHETVDSLGDIGGKIVVDCTLGGGGHTKKLLEKVGPNGKVIAFDRDVDALTNSKNLFKDELEKQTLILIDSPFSCLKENLIRLELWGKISGVIADIGVSSHQIDVDERGFSFSNNGPLDMRMDGRTGMTAADFVNTADESEIADVIWKYGEEQKSRHIASLIVKMRALKPFVTTLDLADLIGRARFWKEKSKKHPATKTFQALRIFINDELGELQTLVKDGFECLEKGGRLSIISFHSLEDRIVKEAFIGLSGKSKSQALPRGLPLTEEQVAKLTNKQGEIKGRFPDVPSEEEISENPRSRSAKLRTIEKI